MDFSRMSDDELLVATARQPEAFGTFYERHVRAVLSYASHATRDTEAALDLTAEVFAAALAARSRYRPGEAPASAWLFGIARKKLAATRRRRARADAARRKLGISTLSFSDSALERAEEILDAERQDWVRRLEDLSADERNAITARVLEERGYTEVAASEGTTEAAIRQRVSRGLAKLAKGAQRNEGA
jgi:RNA polymerase sigma factor (sigma-70 family)